MCHGGENVRRGWGDQEQISAVRQLNVAWLPTILFVKEIRDDRSA